MRDEREFAIDLLFNLGHQVWIVLHAIAADNSFFYALAQEAIHRFAFWYGIARKFVSQIVELKGEPLRQAQGICNRLRDIAE